MINKSAGIAKSNPSDSSKDRKSGLSRPSTVLGFSAALAAARTFRVTPTPPR
jgi:hypothetical protein